MMSVALRKASMSMVAKGSRSLSSQAETMVTGYVFFGCPEIPNSCSPRILIPYSKKLLFDSATENPMKIVGLDCVDVPFV